MQRISIAVVVLIIILASICIVHEVPYKGTVFSPSYNEQAFRCVQKGMPKNKVIHLLGQPLVKEDVYVSNLGMGPGPTEAWIYSRQRNSNSFWLVREVIINKASGTVCGKIVHTREP